MASNGTSEHVREYLFTSESVNEGHPDKFCDIVSDAVLDACLEQDSDSKVACETCCKTGMVMIFGEITTNAEIDYEQKVRDTIKEIGFEGPREVIAKVFEELDRDHSNAITLQELNKYLRELYKASS